MNGIKGKTSTHKKLKKKKKSHLYRDETTTAKVESGLKNAATSTESEDRQTGS